jgi:hypothetical protein
LCRGTGVLPRPLDLDERWLNLALAALFTFGCTWTRYEGWALAAMACIVVSIVTQTRRITATILFMGGAVLGPMLWMLFNMAYFDDPLMFAYGIGSAQVNNTGKTFGTTGKVMESALRYFVDVAYSVNPGVLWLAVGGLVFALILLRHPKWRPTFVILASCFTLFAFYAFNLYTGSISILLPGLVKDDLQSTYNVRYGTVMSSTLPLFAGLFVFLIWHQVERRRVFALLMLAPLVLPDPIPPASTNRWISNSHAICSTRKPFTIRASGCPHLSRYLERLVTRGSL